MSVVAGRDRTRPVADEVPVALEWTMFALALVMLPIVVIQEAAQDQDLVLFAERVSAAIWFAFAGEYLYLLIRASDKSRFVVTHWFDLAIIALTPPIFLFDEMQGFRALRAARVLRALAVVGRAQHALRRHLRRSSLPYALGLAVLVMVVGGVAITALEPDRVTNLWDGLWWAATTMTTVGYGDIAPATFAGRALAVALMVIGIATFAGLTAAIAAHFVESEGGANANEELAALRREMRDLRGAMESLKQR